MDKRKVVLYIGIRLDGIPLFYKGEEQALVLNGVRRFGQFTEVSYRVKAQFLKRVESFRLGDDEYGKENSALR